MLVGIVQHLSVEAEDAYAHLQVIRRNDKMLVFSTRDLRSNRHHDGHNKWVIHFKIDSYIMWGDSFFFEII